MNRSKRSEEIQKALRDAFPIMLAYFPLSMTYGVLAAAGGLPGGMAVFSSVWIFSGGAQFMLLGMLASAAAPVTIVTTLLLLNMRHVLYGATMGPYLATWRESPKWLAAIGLTDEGFAVTSSRAAQGEPISPSYYITFALAIYGSWIAGTAAGTGLGSFVTAELAEVLTFALPALFIALLAGGERTLPFLAAAGCGAVLATLAGMLQLGGIGLIAGGLAGATLGQQLSRILSRRSKAARDKAERAIR
ncbi:AzlC family ABC transporter permease [Paenibacillus phoenicis]|uniref:AzlC family ABC transporter permease n=1 Tax=Paenibacillus phoenicis TaxID=554117 RepID=A0ABU5PFW3_9BACL|nr:MULTISPECIES: AzlC family ABC transporter permease [Paenibacillus]EES71652.1 putative azaleucine resistance protein AzlC [Paenibacillus sp. oral taxon 786 str. D14]MCT2193826.1 AzlC family ABC transporter permease [Paenibacillus sp. p3-SID1389]MEA3568627.1 AzlC family ABC transporter permease [Paenibacillus phoenicis]